MPNSIFDKTIKNMNLFEKQSAEFSARHIGPNETETQRNAC